MFFLPSVPKSSKALDRFFLVGVFSYVIEIDLPRFFFIASSLVFFIYLVGRVLLYLSILNPIKMSFICTVRFFVYDDSLCACVAKKCIFQMFLICSFRVFLCPKFDLTSSCFVQIFLEKNSCFTGFVMFLFEWNTVYIYICMHICIYVTKLYVWTISFLFFFPLSLRSTNFFPKIHSPELSFRLVWKVCVCSLVGCV